MFTIVKNGIFTFVNMKNDMFTGRFFKMYGSSKIDKVKGRFFSHPQLQPLLRDFSKQLKVEQIGTSFLEVPIESLEIGSGPIKILGWSQMHGNESTSTKGLLDLINLLSLHPNEPLVEEILSGCTLRIIPMLNPDGAARYIRENVNGVDLNRDAQLLQEKESRVLRRVFDEFSPDFCLNLHDQRTIFSAGKTAKPATLSFLAPAMDEERNISENRNIAMQIIAAVNNKLQDLIPGQVGRYDDSFNLNCVGDTFQQMRVPTILFEAGHFPNDYNREETRKYFCFALFQTLYSITNGDYRAFDVTDYHSIPENQKDFFDVILRNAVVADQVVDIALQYEELMKGGKVFFRPRLQTMAPKLSYFGHKEIDCKEGVVEPIGESAFYENDIVTAVLLNKEKISIESQDNH